MGLWDRVKKDIQKGVDESIAAVRKGATVAVEKAEELAEEGKMRYKVFELKMKVQSNFTDLGGKVYDLASKGLKNPSADSKVKSTIASIKKLEAKIARLEKTGSKTSKKASKKSKRR
ncbi:MAG: hypothetical protein QMD07_00150 [Thermodesulfovibrionales bacterium]|nr:hypothetical protein [Thermodesulfovibrionales bacterium]